MIQVLQMELTTQELESAFRYHYNRCGMAPIGQDLWPQAQRDPQGIVFFCEVETRQLRAFYKNPFGFNIGPDEPQLPGHTVPDRWIPLPEEEPWGYT